jgi:hypothetical protein
MTTKSDIALTDDTVELTGNVRIKQRDDAPESVTVDSAGGRVSIGKSVSGSLSLRDSDDEERVLIRAKNPDPMSVLRGLSGSGRSTLSGVTSSVELSDAMRDSGLTDLSPVGEGTIGGYPLAADGVRVYIDGERGGIVLGGNDKDGTLAVRNRRGETVVQIDASKEDIQVGDVSVGEQMGKIEAKADRDALEKLVKEVRELRKRVDELEDPARVRR